MWKDVDWKELDEENIDHQKAWYELTFEDGSKDKDYIELRVKTSGNMSDEDIKEYFQEYYEEPIVSIKQIGWSRESLEEKQLVEDAGDKEEDGKIETIDITHEEYTDPEDLVRINNELGEKAKDGKLLGLRKEKDYLMLSEPEINGIWTLYLDEDGNITKIVLF